MVVGYSIIAVPTGIVGVEFTRAFSKRAGEVLACAGCGKEGHDEDASYCKHCGGRL